jgi:lipid-binding SYLF domain-containing protein
MESITMIRSSFFGFALICLFVSQPAWADDYASTIADFKKATESQSFFGSAYGYAVFPTIGKGGFVVGGAHGKGQVYRGTAMTGNTTVTQLSVGFQLGGEAFSQIIFFEDQRAYDRFTAGKFEFSAQAQAVAIVIGAQAQTGTTGTSSGAGDTQFKGIYQNGMAIFTKVKGGLMYEASLAGQKFTFEAS